MSLEELLAKAEKDPVLARADWERLLGLKDEAECRLLYEAAYRVKTREVGRTVSLRGLVEVSNICSKNCYYCGIRSGNHAVKRFSLDRNEIIDTALQADEFHYGSVVLQAGERSDAAFIDTIADAVAGIKAGSRGRLGITLSLGEQERSVYREWFEAGAHRYLLRIEASNRSLYQTIHPADHSYETRVACLENLRETGYQVGTGVMIGLPGQSLADLVDDLEFFRRYDIDMIGMGPYLVHHDTPLAERCPGFEAIKRRQLRLGLNMIAATRLALRDVNIASTTALQALAADGREQGLLAGANVIMPNLTPVRYRDGYKLYDGKPGTDENAEESRDKLTAAIDRTGETVGWDQWGDSRHFARRIQAEQ